MIVWLMCAWIVLNYAFAATLVYGAAQRGGYTPIAAFTTAALWPRELLRPFGVSI